jgi:hypothetical protein
MKNPKTAITLRSLPTKYIILDGITNDHDRPFNYVLTIYIYRERERGCFKIKTLKLDKQRMEYFQI